jgi:hypothetical protein
LGASENIIIEGKIKMTTANDPHNKAATYIGDGAYAAISEQGNLVLTTEDGQTLQNIVVIEPDFYPVLERFIEETRLKGLWPISMIDTDSTIISLHDGLERQRDFATERGKEINRLQKRVNELSAELEEWQR